MGTTGRAWYINKSLDANPADIGDWHFQGLLVEFHSPDFTPFLFFIGGATYHTPEGNLVRLGIFALDPLYPIQFISDWDPNTAPGFLTNMVELYGGKSFEFDESFLKKSCVTMAKIVINGIIPPIGVGENQTKWSEAVYGIVTQIFGPSSFTPEKSEVIDNGFKIPENTVLH